MSLTIPRIPHPVLWAVVSVIVVGGLGVWGTLFPEARPSQDALNAFFRANGNTALDDIARIIDRVFSPTSATIITIGLGILVGVVRRSWMTGAGFAIAVLLAWLPVQIFKVLFHLSRPDVTQPLGGLVAVNANSSYPSGHVGITIGLSYAVLLLMRTGRAKNLVVGALALLILLVAYTRLYAGMHYLTDTIGSVFASLLGILLFQLVWPLISAAASPATGAEATSSGRR